LTEIPKKKLGFILNKNILILDQGLGWWHQGRRWSCYPHMER